MLIDFIAFVCHIMKTVFMTAWIALHHFKLNVTIFDFLRPFRFASVPQSKVSANVQPSHEVMYKLAVYVTECLHYKRQLTISVSMVCDIYIYELVEKKGYYL